jgi:hypothetical protein
MGIRHLTCHPWGLLREETQAAVELEARHRSNPALTRHSFVCVDRVDHGRLLPWLDQPSATSNSPEECGDSKNRQPLMILVSYWR